MSHAQSTIQPDNTASDAYFARSYAKINLTLDVLGKRTDGYHDLATIMQTIDLYDTICLQATEQDEVRILCSRPELSNEDNLAVRAVQAVRQRLSLTQGVVIELHKRIPVAAGLGGGRPFPRPARRGGRLAPCRSGDRPARREAGARLGRAHAGLRPRGAGPRVVFCISHARCLPAPHYSWTAYATV